MAEINPYQAPAETSTQAQNLPFYTDGKFLVIRSGAVLPSRCVKTNQPIPESSLKTRDMSWAHPMIAVLVLLSPLILIIVYFIVRKTCTVTYGVHSDIRRQKRKWFWIKIALAIVLLIAMLVASAADSPIAIMITLLALIAAVISLFIGNSPLGISKHRSGEFWLKGCSEEFLESVQFAEVVAVE